MILDSESGTERVLRSDRDSIPSSRSFSRILGDHANLKIHDFDVHQRTSMETRNRSVPFYVMSYMKEGTSTLRCDRREHLATEGEVIIVPPRTTHDHVMVGSQHSVFLWWHFDLQIGGGLDVLRFIKEPMVFPVEHREHFETEFLVYANMKLRRASTLSAHILRRAKALELLGYLLESASILNYLNDKFGDVPSDFIAMLHDIVNDPAAFRRVNELAEKYDYHPSYIASRFRHFFGVTPSRLGRDLLYEKALILIRSRDISMEEVAFELGFSEPSSFTRFFKSVEGLSPSSLRRSGAEVD